jgi:hypothetical protein
MPKYIFFAFLLVMAWSAEANAQGFEYARLTIVKHVSERLGDYIAGLRFETGGAAMEGSSDDGAMKFTTLFRTLSGGRELSGQTADDLGLLDGLSAAGGWEVINLQSSSVIDPDLHRLTQKTDTYFMKRPSSVLATPSTQPSSTAAPTK